MVKEIDRVDLHGFDRVQAEYAIRSLITDARQRGQLIVHVVHGRGTGILAEHVRSVLDSLMPEAVADYGPLPPREGCGLRIRLRSAKQPEHAQKPRGPGPLKVARDLLKDAKKIEPPRG